MEIIDIAPTVLHILGIDYDAENEFDENNFDGIVRYDILSKIDNQTKKQKINKIKTAKNSKQKEAELLNQAIADININ